MVLKQCDFFWFLLRNVLFYILFLMMCAVRVGSLNINGARDIQKIMLLFELIKQKDIYVMYVQERKLIVIVSTLMTGKENGREKFC